MSITIEERYRIHYELSLTDVSRNVMLAGCKILLKGVPVFDKFRTLSKHDQEYYFNKPQRVLILNKESLDRLDVSHLVAIIMAFGGLTPGPHSLISLIRQLREKRNKYEHGKHNISIDKIMLHNKLNAIEVLCIDILNKLKCECSNLTEVTLVETEITNVKNKLLRLKKTADDDTEEKTKELQQVASQIPPITTILENAATNIPPITADLENAASKIPPITADLENAASKIPPITADLENAALQIPPITAELRSTVGEHTQLTTYLRGLVGEITQLTTELQSTREELKEVAKTFIHPNSEESATQCKVYQGTFVLMAAEYDTTYEITTELKKKIEDSVNDVIKEFASSRRMKFIVSELTKGSVSVDFLVITTEENESATIELITKMIRKSGLKGLHVPSITVIAPPQTLPRLQNSASDITGGDTVTAMVNIPSSDIAGRLPQVATRSGRNENIDTQLPHPVSVGTKSVALDLKNKGNEYLSAGRAHLALELYNQAVVLEPHNHLIYSNRCNALTKLEKYQEALQDADKVLELMPGWPMGYFRRGTALVYMKEYRLAAETYQKGIVYMPDNAYLREGLEYCKQQMQQQKQQQQQPLKLWNQGRLYTEVLEQVLLRSDIADLPVVILAVGGEYRTGKSFLLSYIIRYLRYLDCRPKDKNQKVTNDWIGDPSDPLQGFQYKNTGVPVTTGIDIWSEPFVIENEGKKVAIILMDTQGIFDNEHTEEESNFIFSFSMMVSSVFVFNIPRNLNDHHHIERLKKFTDYAKECKTDNSQKEFQKLMFLVRDSPRNEYGFGIEEGGQMLTKYLEKDVGDLRMFIRDTWEDIDCYLMPHPGFGATEQEDFDGNFAGLRKEFQSHLKKLIEELLSPDKLVIKKISGSEITAAQLYLHIKSSEKNIDNFMKIKASFICEQAGIRAYTDFQNKITDLVESSKLLRSEKEFQDESDKLYKHAVLRYIKDTSYSIPAQFPDIGKEKKVELEKKCLTIQMNCMVINRKKTEKTTEDSEIKNLIKMVREPWWKKK